MAEEMPDSYEDAADVVQVLEAAHVTQRVARLMPFAEIQGERPRAHYSYHYKTKKREESMKKAQARGRAMAGQQKAGKSTKPASKKPIAKAARVRSAAQKAPAAKKSTERDFLAEAIVELVEISSDVRELLGEIRDLLAEREEIEDVEGTEVDTLVIAEGEGPERLEEESRDEEESMEED